MRRIILFAALVSVTAACGGASDQDHLVTLPHQANADIDWRDQVIYQIMVDRFENGDRANDYNVEPSVPARYHGGDWRGIRERLDYLEELGVTALWISPVVRNVEEDAGFHSYHGYWTQDFLRPNPHFGNLEDLRALVDDAHSRGMLVILDIVTNHMGQLFYYDINGNGQPDDSLAGGGTNHSCVQICNNPGRADECSPDEQVYCEEGINYFERIIEWDPEYDPRGIQGWTSLGFSGPAEIKFLDWPSEGRTPPPRPPSWFDWPADQPWFDDPSWYHRKGRVYVWWHEGDYSREFVRNQETQGDFPGGLKDLDTENPVVQEALIRSFQYWIDVADFDGFRIDTLKHMDRPEIEPDVRGFVGNFSERIRAHAAAVGKQNFFLFGEAFDGNDELIGSYTFGGEDEAGRFGRVDSVFYFSQKYRVIDPVFKQGGPTKHVECLHRARLGLGADAWCQGEGYPIGPTYEDEPHATTAQGGTGIAPNQLLVGFLDNHDLERFLFQDATVPMLHNALFYLMTWDGIPCLYYGTEQEFDGGTDPRNREDMFLGNPDRGLAPFDTTGETFQYVKALVAMRKEHVALRRGTASVIFSSETGPGILAFTRTHADQTVLVVMNTSDAEASETFDVPFPAGSTLVDVAPGSEGATFTVAGDGTLTVSVSARGGRLLVDAATRGSTNGL